MSISSEDSFASCTSYPYSEDLMKSDGSRSVTPSVASDRLSRDDLDQYCMQTESSRSMNSLIDNLQEGQMTTSSTQESLVVSSAGLVSCSCYTIFTLTQLNQIYQNQVKFQPIKCVRFVGLSNQKAPFDNLVSFKLVLLASVKGVLSS